MDKDIWSKPFTYDGVLASLHPLDMSHQGALREAVLDGDLWKLWYARVPSPNGMEDEISRRLKLSEEGKMMPFTVLDANKKVVGMTSYQTLDPNNRRVEIGYTWYSKSVQRTLLNTEIKLKLLSYAFETLDVIAVGFTTSTYNQSSRNAIERLGAKLDGVLRNHSILPDGTLRDTCYYSIISSEWPAVKRNLLWKLDRSY